MAAQNENRPKKLIRQALAELESSVYDGDSVKFAYLQLDTIASAFRELYEELIPEDDDASPDTVFEKLIPYGLDKEASDDAAELAKLASRKWYDNKSEDEKVALDNAEGSRDRLFSLISKFLKKNNTPIQQLPFPSKPESSS